MTSNGKNKLEDVVIAAVRDHLRQLIAHTELNVEALRAKEMEDIKTGHIPNNHWQERWKMEQRLAALVKAYHALD